MAIEIKDGGDKVITCSDCGKELMIYRVYAPNVDITHKLLATCPCGGRSFVQMVHGMIYTGPISIELSKHPTVINNIEMDDETGISTFYIKDRK